VLLLQQLLLLLLLLLLLITAPASWARANGGTCAKHGHMSRAVKSHVT
jgi:hypothetical protein